FTLLVGTHGNGMFVVSPPSVPVISLASNSASQLEQTSNTIDCRAYTDLNIDLNISAGPVGDAIVNFTEAGSATAGLDYDILTPGASLTFPAGATTTQTLQIRIYDDAEVEGTETLDLSFTVSGATDAVASSNNTYTLTLLDNEDLPFSILYQEDFESPMTFGTFASLDWAFGYFNDGIATGLNGWIQGTQGGLSGSSSIYISSDGLNNVYDANTQDWTVIKSAQIDATGYSNLELSFDFICNGNANDYGLLYYSLDGLNYNYIEGSGTGPYVNTLSPTNRTITLPAILDNTTFFLGWSWFNDASVGNNPPFAVDNIEVRSTPDPIETVLNATDEAYLGPFSTVYYYDGPEIIASIQNLSAYDYGCTSITIDRAGTGASPAWSPLAGDELADKTIMVTPSNNTPGATDSYVLTYYMTQTEFDGWVANSDPNYTAADFKLIKSPGPISGLSLTNQNASVNQATTFEVYGNAGYTFSGTFDGGFSGFGGGNPPSPSLPVGLLDFSGSQIEEQIQLVWETTWEQNNEGFSVERLDEKGTFTAIGYREAIGNGNQSGNYQFTDVAPYDGLNIYRLRQIDQNGEFQYSDRVRVSFSRADQLRIGPNPFQDELEIYLHSPGREYARLQIFSLSGQLVWEGNWQFEDEIRKRISLAHLSQGTYTYQLRLSNSRYQGKVIKQ
ncbi:MAG: T9SS type A sorting domain-containing protein, partial [Bacteroidota bacterium]